MSDIAIQVDNLSKRYRIGMREKSSETFVGAVSNIMARPVKNFQRLRSLSTFSKNGHQEEDIIWALRDVSFEVKRGEALGIIGRNGAGKSTLLKVLTRITDPTSGRATIHGRVGSLLEVGTGFHPELTGRENVYLNGTILGMRKKEIDRKFDEIVDFSGVEKFIDTPVKRYSSGMRVRLAFAVAAHLDPEILIIDEVLAVGDAEFQRKCLGKMENVAGEGRTVLFVSHNMSAVQALTSQCIYLEGGRIGSLGPTTEIVQHYLASVEPVNNDYDFTNSPRLSHTHGQKMRIRKITPKPQNDSGFYFGQALNFEVELASKVMSSGLRFGVTIEDITDHPILTTTTPKVVSTRPNELTCYEIAITDSNLVPGTYRLSLSIGEGSQAEPRLNFDIVNPGPTFSICPIAQHRAVPYQWLAAFGAIWHTDCEVIRHDSDPNSARDCIQQEQSS